MFDNVFVSVSATIYVMFLNFLWSRNNTLGWIISKTYSKKKCYGTELYIPPGEGFVLKMTAPCEHLQG